MRPEHSIRRPPGRSGRADGHRDRPRLHGWSCQCGQGERRCRLAGDHPYERVGPRRRGTRRAWEAAAGQSLMRSVLGAPIPPHPQSRSGRRLTREDCGHPCSIAEVEHRYCRYLSVLVLPSARMSPHRCLVTAPSTHFQIDPLVPPAWPFPLRHWTSIAPTGRDDQAGGNQRACKELRRAKGPKVPVPPSLSTGVHAPTPSATETVGRGLSVCHASMCPARGISGSM
jgi:hypothetical protein